MNIKNNIKYNYYKFVFLFIKNVKNNVFTLNYFINLKVILRNN